VVELSIQEQLRQLSPPAELEIGLYPQLRAVDVRLTARSSNARAADRLLDRFERRLRRSLGDAVYGQDGDSLEEVIGRRLTAAKRTLAVAESCTGGLIADRLTDVPGSSAYFLGSAVAYDNRVKRGWLGVPAQTLATHGAVSAATAKAMAAGVKAACGADIGLSVTGIAGPDGGTARKPVGLVFLGLAAGRAALARTCRFFGDRRSIKTQARTPARLTACAPLRWS
jgi:nicotinamide-nucleotide amidase